MLSDILLALEPKSALKNGMGINREVLTRGGARSRVRPNAGVARNVVLVKALKVLMRVGMDGKRMKRKIVDCLYASRRKYTGIGDEVRTEWLSALMRNQ